MYLSGSFLYKGITWSHSILFFSLHTAVIRVYWQDPKYKYSNSSFIRVFFYSLSVLNKFYRPDHLSKNISDFKRSNILLFNSYTILRNDNYLICSPNQSICRIQNANNNEKENIYNLMGSLWRVAGFPSFCDPIQSL